MKMKDKKAAMQLRNLSRLLTSFTSMQCGIFLILLLSVLSVSGSFLPHAEAMEAVYRSWWYVSLFILVALNLLACTLRRLQQLRKGYSISGTGKNSSAAGELSAYPYRFEIDKSTARLDSRHHAAELLKQNNYHLQDLKLPRGEALLAAKGRIGIYGSLATHLGLLLIIAAAYYGVLTGSEELAQGFPGERIAVSIGDETLVLEIADFNINYREDGSVNQYYSELIIRSQDPESPLLVHDTIYVNNPLRYGRKTFYQSSYGWAVNAYLHDPFSGRTESAMLVPGQEYYFAPAGITVQLLSFYPDLEQGDQGHLFSRSPEPRHPHTLFRLLDQDNQLLGSPAQLLKIGDSLELPQFELGFDEFHNFTGILIKETGGTICLLSGSIIFLAGLFLCFFVQPRQILMLWPGAAKDEGKLIIYGWSRTDRPAFAVEFYEIVNDLVNGRRELS